MKFSRINAFGRQAPAGREVRISFDERFAPTTGEPAAFVLELVLSSDGSACTMRQTGSSRRDDGLVLSAQGNDFHEQRPVQKGRLLNLTQLSRGRLGSFTVVVDIKLPGSPAVLTFQAKGSAGQNELSLLWNSGTTAAVTTPAPASSSPRPAPATTRTPRAPRRRAEEPQFWRGGIRQVLAPMTGRVDLPGRRWYPVFATADEAEACGRFIAAIFRRLLRTDGGTSVEAQPNQGLFCPVITVPGISAGVATLDASGKVVGITAEPDRACEFFLIE